MTACFADTFYYFALLNPADEAHEAAMRLTASLHRPVVTSAWVLTELADGLADTDSRGLFAAFVRQLRLSKLMTVIPHSESLFDQSVRLYEARPDKQWSLTDCSSIVVMQQLAITDVLTGDHHFRQAGFNPLFKS